MEGKIFYLKQKKACLEMLSKGVTFAECPAINPVKRIPTSVRTLSVHDSCINSPFCFPLPSVSINLAVVYHWRAGKVAG